MDEKLKKERMGEIIEAVKKVARGDYSVQIKLSGKNDDIDSLAMGLNMMIDDIKETLEALNESKEKFKTQYKGIPVPTYTWQWNETRNDFELIEYNNAAMTITRGDVADFVGKPAREMYSERPDILEDISRCFREKLPIKREITLQFKKSGRIKHLEVSYVHVPPDLVMVHTEDITERRILQEKLVRQERLAVLGQLAGGVGHELRNPLGAIKNSAYFLKMALEDPMPEVKETLEILEKEVATSEKIISSLLDYARARPPLKRKVNINDIIRKVLSGSNVPQNIEVKSQIDKFIPTIMADPDQLGLVFGNILLNAIQAMPDGGRLIIKSETTDPDGAAVSITDTGVGIPKEDIEKIFEPLFTSRAKGIGLGMAITKTFVEGHGGTIEVQSEIGKGSTFTVRLPLGKKEE